VPTTVDTLIGEAGATFRRDVGAVLGRLTAYLKAQLAAGKVEGGKLAKDRLNLELAAKLAKGYAAALRAAGYDRALANLLRSYERIAAATEGQIEDKLGESFSSPNLRALARLAERGIDDLLVRGQEAGERLREIVVHGANGNTPIADLVEKLSEAAGITLRQAVVEAQTQLMAFHRDGLAVESYDAGIDLFEYTGPDDGIIRDFCSLYVGKIVTLQDLDEADNGSQPKPVSRFLGGWRCRHSLSPLSLEEAQARFEAEGRRCIGPGCTLALRIVSGKVEGPAAKAFTERNLGEFKGGRVVRRRRAVA
jgi:hypothetical protein